jgi:hypothetical protein
MDNYPYKALLTLPLAFLIVKTFKHASVLGLVEMNGLIALLTILGAKRVGFGKLGIKFEIAVPSLSEFVRDVRLISDTATYSISTY